MMAITTTNSIRVNAPIPRDRLSLFITFGLSRSRVCGRPEPNSPAPPTNSAQQFRTNLTGSAGRRHFRANLTRKNCPPRLRAWRNSKPPAPIQHNHRWTQMNTNKNCPKPRFSRSRIRSQDTEPKKRGQIGFRPSESVSIRGSLLAAKQAGGLLLRPRAKCLGLCPQRAQPRRPYGYGDLML